MTDSWEPIDCLHRGYDRAVAVYLAETDSGLALVDTGPASTLAALEAGLEARGVSLGELSHILLTHIHLDHAGGAGPIVRRHPHIQVHVSEIGARHVVDPSRLERSARQLYGERFDTLWGELAPVPAENVHVVGDRVLGLDCFPAPGHAKHHVVYVDGAGTMYCGDAAGGRIQPGRHIFPLTPPPDVDVDGWRVTLDEMERRSPERLLIAHFGVKTDVADHLTRLRERLELWAARIGGGMPLQEFLALEQAELKESGGEAEVKLYQRSDPLDQSYAGMKRYWDKKREAEAEAATAAAPADADPAAAPAADLAAGPGTP